MAARARTFPVALGLIVLAAVAIRAVYVLTFDPTATGLNDTFWYRVVGQSISDGQGFLVPVGNLFTGHFHHVPTAQHPPAYAVLLGGLDALGITGEDGQRLFGAVLGGCTVAGTGLLGRRAGGPPVGLIAAGIAAVYPLLVVADGALLSETLYGPIVAFLLLAAWRLGEAPSVGRAAVVGAGVGLAALTRSEALLLLPLLALPLAWRGGRPGRLLRLAVAVSATALVLAPWVVRNWTTFDRPLLSTNDGTTVAWTNCEPTYYGDALGYKSNRCIHAVTGNEAEQAAKQRRAGIDYAKAHLGRLPVVVAARVAGTWSLFAPFRVTDPGRPATVVKAGIFVYWVLLALAVVGLLALRRRGGPLLVLVAPFVVVTLTAAASYSSLRGRFLAEIPLVVLAAAGAHALATRRGPIGAHRAGAARAS